jgi:hypothetical protein
MRLKRCLVISALAASVCVGASALCASVPPRHALRFDSPAADSYKGWEQDSLPIGCGWFGANVFGGIASERIEFTDNTLLVGGNLDGVGRSSGNRGMGLTSAGNLRIDFPFETADGYARTLSLDEAIAKVDFTVDGVRFTREFFASYPARVLAGRLTASKPGALSFTIRFDTYEFDRTAKKRASGRSLDVDQLFGKFAVRHALRLTVDTDGTVTADGESLKVSGATRADLFLAGKSNYRLEPRVFLESDPLKKLAGNPDPRGEAERIAAAAVASGYDSLKAAHLADYRALYDRVSLDLGGTDADSVRTTPELKAAYAKGENSAYLEELLFQFGRYLLISSSRPGTMPANLQGTWACGERSPWGAGYWHNINIQMNYWPAFSCNLAECFEAYAAFHEAIRPAARKAALAFLGKYVPENVPKIGESPDLWVTGCVVYPYALVDIPGGSSGPGMGGLTGKMFADWWDYAQDRAALERYIRPALNGLADFLVRTTREYDGKRLAVFSASPEMLINVERYVHPGGVYYHTVGCAFDQQMIAESVADAVRIGGFKTSGAVNFDPVQIGWSGQLKEYREENYYGEIGMYHHRHVSQLVGLMPGLMISPSTPAWCDAARFTLRERGDWATGWALAHRLCLWARAGCGDDAYRLYRTLIAEKTYRNMWDTHPPFQIDGNFGATAGVAEMLLQSRSGEVRLLPSLPRAWSAKGSFRGLRARGGYVVDCHWRDGKVVRFDVRGGKGKPKVILPDVRSFAKGPAKLRLERASMTLSWEPSAADDATYTVLRNTKSSPDYTTLATGIRSCRFTDAAVSFPNEDYITYKIVDSSGAFAVKTFSRATELEKQRYLNFLRCKGSVEPYAPWIPTTKAPQKSLDELE